MEDWTLRAIARWPNVPALFGWLALDRRGRWRIRGEPISRPQIIDTINRNYAADEHGRWYFQNGPQRGYMHLAYAPLIVSTDESGAALFTHTGLRVEHPAQAFLDEDGALLLATEHGAGQLAEGDLDWALQRLRHPDNSTCDPADKPADNWVDERQLAEALALPDGASTALTLHLPQGSLPVVRLNAASAPAALGFVREPQPRADEDNACDPARAPG